MYLINQHKVHIHCQQRQLATQMKDELSSVFHDDFYPRLEKLLMEYDQQNMLWQIDHLPISIHTGIDHKNWKTELVEQSLEQIKQFLKASKPARAMNDHLEPSKRRIQTQMKETHIHSVLTTYLKTGILKTSALVSNLKQLFDYVEMDPQFTRELESILKNQYYYILRWTFNIPGKIKKQYLKLKGISQNLNFTEGLEEKDLSKADFLEYLFWVSIFTTTPNHLNVQTNTNLKKIADHYFSIKEKDFEKMLKLQSTQEFILSDSKKSKPKETKEEPYTLLENQESYYISNAGLVLLHPFLPPLFKQLGYLNKDGWKHKKMQHRAVLLFQYLTNFEEEIFENDLVLNKLLCGVPISETITTKWKISKQEKEHCDELLRSVIKHWTILKKTSANTLQESFLRREGKIMLTKNEHFELTVAQESIDLLLDQLPWGLGMIKTPWMEDYITCNWN